MLFRSVMAMPILPWLTDGDESLDALFGALSAAGATGVTAGALHLRPGAREWFLAWIARDYPHLSGKYARLYGGGTYASKEYRQWLAGRVQYFKKKHGFTSRAEFLPSRSAAANRPEQPTRITGAVPTEPALSGPALSQPAVQTLF